MDKFSLKLNFISKNVFAVRNLVCSFRVMRSKQHTHLITHFKWQGIYSRWDTLQKQMKVLFYGGTTAMISGKYTYNRTHKRNHFLIKFKNNHKSIGEIERRVRCFSI